MNEHYDSQKLASLIATAVGSCKKKDFALKVDITPQYFSRILNCKVQNPPSLDCLKRIAAYASNGVTYQQLLEAAGYSSIPESTTSFSSDEYTFFQATILTALSALNIPFVTESTSEQGCNLTIFFQQAPISHWFFYYVDNSDETSQKQQMAKIYSNLVLHPFNATDKISIVTSQISEFDYYCNQIPNLDLNLSVILIDQKSLSVQNERWIKSNKTLQAEEIALLSL